MSAKPPVILGKEDYQRYMSQQSAAAHRVFRFRPMTAEQREGNKKRARLRLIRQVARRKALKAEKGGSNA